MEPLARLDSNSILAEDIFLEIFDQEDEIMKVKRLGIISVSVLITTWVIPAA